jgi:hypothetical protein
MYMYAVQRCGVTTVQRLRKASFMSFIEAERNKTVLIFYALRSKLRPENYYSITVDK